MFFVVRNHSIAETVKTLCHSLPTQDVVRWVNPFASLEPSKTIIPHRDGAVLALMLDDQNSSLQLDLLHHLHE